MSMCEELRHLSTGSRPSKKPGKPALQPTPIWKSPRKRAVLGFIVSVHSIIECAEKVLFRSEHPFKYVLTYRFCQDLIELFFNKIRGRLGSNNNLNVLEFENTMKKIWHQNLLKSTSTGNSIIQMAEKDVPGELFPLQRPKVKHCQDFSMFSSNCLAYIAGNVVKSISLQLKCGILFKRIV